MYNCKRLIVLGHRSAASATRLRIIPVPVSDLPALWISLRQEGRIRRTNRQWRRAYQ